MKNPIPKKYQPRGYEIFYEDRDLLVGNKVAGFATVPAKWSRGDSLYDTVTHYLRKGNARSPNIAYVVHRLDQATSGALIFAKSERAQDFLKDNWSTTTKTYYAIVHGHLKQTSGRISSYLTEDEDYVVHSNQKAEGRLSHTEYEVLSETAQFSLLKINLLTGRKNQIRVHMADAGHPLVGDDKYGPASSKHKNLALHSYAIAFQQPHTRERLSFETKVPEHFHKLVPFSYRSTNGRSDGV